MIVSANRQLGQRRERDAFTLLEVLVVVAILVILASIAGVYVFKYLEDARVDTARNQMTIFENACKNYMAKNGGTPPQSLQDLVAPQDGNKPYIEGGIGVLNSPFGDGSQYMLEQNQDQYGAPDPRVYLMYNGQKLYSSKRMQQGQ